MRRILPTVLALALLLAAAPLLAYTIFLKDGTRLEAREKYKVSGTTALIILPNGAHTTLPLAQIDVVRTQASNVSDYGDATILAPPSAAATPRPAEAAPGLAELAARRRTLPPPPPRASATVAPAAAAAAGVEAAKGATAHTAAGFVDFLRLPRTPISHVEVASAVSDLLHVHGLETAAIYEGSQPRRLLVEVTTNSEGAVFQAINGAAHAMADLEAKRPGALEGLELFLATDRRQRAGQFFVTAARARELVGRQIDLTGFYLKYVEF
ncbi:MAG TPA: hypothetical protein VGV61_01230 [Thermoanaerobaculia bacterium]|jgi:hypothetical protein|nr:hypothetical protein [Thermoanaerobaculia bacterium]